MPRPGAGASRSDPAEDGGGSVGLPAGHLAFLFEEVGKIEKEHEERYRKLLKNIEEGRVFEKDGKVYWQCANCGHIHEGLEAPEVCPVCSHPRAYFQMVAKNY